MSSNLAHLQVGQVARIHAVSGPTDLRHRLQELGFVPGSTVRLVAQAAFGGAMAFQVRGTTIALRRNDAALVET